MNFKNIKNYQDTIIFIIEVVILEAIVLFTQLLSVEFEFTKIKYDIFVLNFFISVFAKVLSTQYSSKKTLLNTEIVNREKTIIDLFCDILNQNKMIKFDEVLHYECELKKLDKALVYLNKKKYQLNRYKISNKQPKPYILNSLSMIEEDVNKVILLKKTLLSHKYEEYEEHEKVFKFLDVNKIKQKYITSSDLFRKSQKNLNTDNFNNIYYSEVRSNLSYNLPFMILSIIISYCLACFYIGSNFTSTQSIINALTLSFSLANGVYSGFRNGNKIIINDYKFVLDERIQIIKETYSKIGTNIEKASLIG